MRRRKFLQNCSSVFLFLAGGQTIKLDGEWIDTLDSKKLWLRFAIASDGHYGQPDTQYRQFFKTLVDQVNHQHASNPFAFCMINGDIIHDDKNHTAAAKVALDQLQVKYYVSQGNHDMLTAAEWEQQWKMPINLHFKSKLHNSGICPSGRRKN